MCQFALFQRYDQAVVKHNSCVGRISFCCYGLVSLDTKDHLLSRDQRSSLKDQRSFQTALWNDDKRRLVSISLTIDGVMKEVRTEVSMSVIVGSSPCFALRLCNVSGKRQ